MPVKVGSFAKSTGGAPASQAVTGLGFQPTVLIMWTAGKTTANAWSDDYLIGFGVTTGASNSYSVAMAADGGVATTNTSRRMVAKALTIVQWGESLLAECDLTSFDADGFTLSWTTNNASAYIIHYLAFSGTTGAKILEWAVPEATGNYGVTGAGFQPTAVLHFMAHSVSALPYTGANAQMMIGAMTATAQGMVFIGSDDANPSVSATPKQSAARCGGMYTPGGTTLYEFQYASLDADGFTCNITNNGDGTNRFCFSLCLAGVDVAIINTTTSVDGSAQQAITGVGFLPEAGLFLTTNVDLHLGIGADDGTNRQAVDLADKDGADPSTSGAISSTAYSLILNPTADQTSEYEGYVTSLGADGLTIQWDTYPVTTGHWLKLLAIKTSAAVVSGHPTIRRFGHTLNQGSMIQHRAQGVRYG